MKSRRRPAAAQCASPASRTVLLIAFHFPPIQGSSGVQRTLRFAQHLPSYGWRPVVLTITPQAYESTSAAIGNEIPHGVYVHRAAGLDAARQLSVFGRYPRFLAMPDRWASWRYWAVPAALRIIREQHVTALWSTFPIATAHSIAARVARQSSLPWIAEFRDPMWQGDYPVDRRVNVAWQSLERETFEQARRVVVTTPGAVSEYVRRFGPTGRSKLELIENGYDEETFVRAATTRACSMFTSRSRTGRPVTLLHSGVIYKSERDPSQLFAAISSLKNKGLLSPDQFRVVLRSSGDDRRYARDLAALGIQDIVHLEPAIEYLAALREMLDADGLLLLQAANCNAQIPAKLYEYLRAGRPILALTDPAGDTAKTLEAAGAGLIARLDSADDIESALLRFIHQVREGTWRRPSRETIEKYSRQAQTGQLARLLDEVLSDAS